MQVATRGSNCKNATALRAWEYFDGYMYEIFGYFHSLIMATGRTDVFFADTRVYPCFKGFMFMIYDAFMCIIDDRPHMFSDDAVSTGFFGVYFYYFTNRDIHRLVDDFIDFFHIPSGNDETGNKLRWAFRDRALVVFEYAINQVVHNNMRMPRENEFFEFADLFKKYFYPGEDDFVEPGRKYTEQLRAARMQQNEANPDNPVNEMFC